MNSMSRPPDIVSGTVGQSLEDHWKTLLDLIDLVSESKLRKALRQWVNKNQNCAYSVKSGHCSMNCESCLNDVTMGILVPDKESKNENNLSGMQKPRHKRDGD